VTAWHWMLAEWHWDLHARVVIWLFLLHFFGHDWVNVAEVIAFLWVLRHRDSVQRLAVRLRNKIPGKPDRDGWRARVNYERKDPQ